MDCDDNPLFAGAPRPSAREIQHYSRLIMEREQRPPSSRPECEREAELQLWAMRAVEPKGRRPSDARKKRADR